jgi:hypothetical protein
VKNTFRDFINSILDNETLIKFYSKKSCNKCYGRGYQTFKIPGSHLHQKVICPCLQKMARKKWDEIKRQTA